MTITHQKFFALAIILFLFFSLTNQVVSQIPIFPSNDSNYRVSIGDKMQYIYDVVNEEGYSYFYYPLILENRSIVDVNITKGTILTTTIMDKNGTSSGQNLYIKNDFSLPGIYSYSGKTYENFNSLIPTFDTQSSVDSYITNLYFDNNLSPKSIVKVTYSVNDTYLLLNMKISGIVLYSNLDQLFNWHNGWMESSNYSLAWYNGSLLSQVILRGLSNNLINTSIIKDVFYLVYGPFACIFVLLIVFNFKKKKNFSE